MAIKITDKSSATRPENREPSAADWEQYWKEFEIRKTGRAPGNPLSRTRQFMLSKISQGVCGYCPEHRPLVTQTYCEECRKKRNEQYRELIGPPLKRNQYKSREGLKKQLFSLKIGDSIVVPSEGYSLGKLRRRILATTSTYVGISIRTKILLDGIEVTRVR